MRKHTIYRKLLSKSSLTVYKKNVYCYKQIWRMQSREPCFAKFDRTNDFASKYQSIKVIIFLFQFHSKSQKSDLEVGDDYNIPHWMNHRY